jgi:hypothetical protein
MEPTRTFETTRSAPSSPIRTISPPKRVVEREAFSPEARLSPPLLSSEPMLASRELSTGDLLTGKEDSGGG